MNIRTQILVAAVAILGILLLIYMIRGNKIRLKYALLWFVLAVGILIFGCFPGLTKTVAEFFGISQPVNMLFFAGFCFSLMIIFSLTAAVSGLWATVKKLTQELALLKKEQEELREVYEKKKTG